MTSRPKYAHVCDPSKQGLDQDCPACRQERYYDALEKMKLEGAPADPQERLVWASQLPQEDVDKAVNQLRLRFGAVATAIAFDRAKVDARWTLGKLKELTHRKNPPAIRAKAIEMIRDIHREALDRYDGATLQPVTGSEAGPRHFPKDDWTGVES